MAPAEHNSELQHADDGEGEGIGEQRVEQREELGRCAWRQRHEPPTRRAPSGGLTPARGVVGRRAEQPEIASGPCH